MTAQEQIQRARTAAHLGLAAHDQVEGAIQVLSFGGLHVGDVHLVLSSVHGHRDCASEAIGWMPLVPLHPSSEVIHQPPLCKTACVSRRTQVENASSQSLHSNSIQQSAIIS